MPPWYSPHLRPSPGSWPGIGPGFPNHFSAAESLQIQARPAPAPLLRRRRSAVPRPPTRRLQWPGRPLRCSHRPAAAAAAPASSSDHALESGGQAHALKPMEGTLRYAEGWDSEMVLKNSFEMCAYCGKPGKNIKVLFCLQKYFVLQPRMPEMSLENSQHRW